MNLKKSEETNSKNKIFTGAISLTFSVFIVKMLGLIYKIPLSSILGDEGMGYFNSAYTAYTFFYIICSSGVPKSVMILISQYEAKGKRGSDVYKIALLIFGMIGFASMLTLTFLSPFIAKAVGSSKAAFSMVSIAPSLLFLSICGVIRGKLNAKMQLIEIGASQVIEGVGKLVFGLAFAIIASRVGMALHLISAFTILGITVGSALCLVYLMICSKKEKQEEISRQKEFASMKETSKRLLLISIPITVSACIMSISSIIDLALIMRNLKEIGYSEEQASALYGNYTTLAVPMFNLAMALVGPICIAFMPAMTRAGVVSDKKRLIEAEESAGELVSFISAPITLGLIFFSKEILFLIFPNSNIEIGSHLLIILSPAIIFASLLSVVNCSLEAVGFVKAPLISMGIGGFVKLLVSYFLIKNESFGISGAPIGTVISYAVSLIVSLIIYGKKIGAFPKAISLCIKPYFLAIISMTTSCYIYNTVVYLGYSNLNFIVNMIITATIYLILSITSGVLNNNKITKMAKHTNFTT